VRAEHLTWLRGEDQVKYFESSPGFNRGFCGNCGSPVVNRPGPGYKFLETNPDSINELGLPLGILDDDPGVRPESHMFVEEQAPWHEITDALPRFDRLPTK
jgi:hypothetical protein